MEKGDFGKIRKAIRHNQRLATEDYNGGITSEDEWAIYDSPLEHFGISFRTCLPYNASHSSNQELSENHFQK